MHAEQQKCNKCLHKKFTLHELNIEQHNMYLKDDFHHRQKGQTPKNKEQGYRKLLGFVLYAVATYAILW